MARYRSIKNSFLGGELSPKTDGRTDLPIFLQGAREQLNMLTMPQGGSTRRPGSQYARTPSAGDARLLPFIFSETEANALYVLDGSIAIPYSTALSNVSTSGVKRLLGLGAGISTESLGADEQTKIQYAQSGDIIMTAHPSRKPYKMIRTAEDTFWCVDFDYDLSGALTGEALVKAYPYLDFNTTATTLTASATTGTGITVTASDDVFDAGHVGAIFKISSGSLTGAFKVTAFTDSTHVTADVLVDLPGTTAMADWEESAWSDYRGWPRSVCFFEKRLIFGGSESYPDTIWASQAYDYQEFMARRFLDDTDSGRTDTDTTILDTTFRDGVRNDDPFSFTISTSRASFIQWLAARDVLVAGTTGQEIAIYGANPQLGLGPLNPGIEVLTSHGSSHVQATVTADAVIFVGRDGRTVRALSPKANTDSKQAKNLSQFADHLTVPDGGTPARIVQIEFQESQSTIWALTDTGKLLSAFYDSENGISAWSHHELAGTDVSVQSIACIPSNDGRNDDVWLAVSRTINGSTVKTLEVIGAGFELSTLDDASAVNVDSPFLLDAAFALTNASPSTSVTGLTWLEGETVAALGDGAYLGTYTVSGGAITLSTASTNIVVGLPYTSRLIPSRVEAGSQIGSAQGAIKRHDKVVARFYRSASCSYGSTTSNLKTINFRPASVASSAPIPLFTGDKKLDWPGGYDENPDVIFQTSDPLPMTILSVITSGVEYDV